jgi:hypothetical protein
MDSDIQENKKVSDYLTVKFMKIIQTIKQEEDKFILA